MSKQKLYVGCGLTQAPEAFREQVELLKDDLRADYEVFDFVGLVDGTAEDVFRWDIGHCVANCDKFVAICDEPSLGLGWEMCEATRLGKPTLAVAHEDTKITRLVLGAAGELPNLEFRRYQNLRADVPRFLAELSLPQHSLDLSDVLRQA